MPHSSLTHLRHTRALLAPSHQAALLSRLRCTSHLIDAYRASKCAHSDQLLRCAGKVIGRDTKAGDLTPLTRCCMAL